MCRNTGTIQLMMVDIHTGGLPWCFSCKESTCNAGATGDTGSIPGSGRSLEEDMATRSNILPWRMPWKEEPGELGLRGSQSVRRD